MGSFSLPLANCSDLKILVLLSGSSISQSIAKAILLLFCLLLLFQFSSFLKSSPMHGSSVSHLPVRPLCLLCQLMSWSGSASSKRLRLLEPGQCETGRLWEIRVEFLLQEASRGSASRRQGLCADSRGLLQQPLGLPSPPRARQQGSPPPMAPETLVPCTCNPLGPRS